MTDSYWSKKWWQKKAAKRSHYDEVVNEPNPSDPTEFFTKDQKARRAKANFEPRPATDKYARVLSIGDKVSCESIVPDDFDNLITYQCKGIVIGIITPPPLDCLPVGRVDDCCHLPFTLEQCGNDSIIYVWITSGLPKEDPPLPTIEAFLGKELIAISHSPVKITDEVYGYLNYMIV